MQGRDVVLGLLNENSRSGYEIKNIIETQLAYFFDASIGMIYPTLRKLEKEGKIKKERIYQTDKPNKNVYTITAAGKAEFQAYLNSPVAADIYKSDCLMRLYFGKNLASTEVIRIIQQEIQRKKELLNYLQQQYDHWQEAGINSIQKITLDYGIAEYTATINFLVQALTKLQN